MRHWLAAAALLTLLTPVRARATPIIDQSCCASINAVSFFNTLTTRVQTFTVGVAGQMTGIDLGLVASGALPTFELFAGAFSIGQDVASFGAPLGTLLPIDSGVPLPPSMFGGHFFFASLGAGILVAPGQQFSIVMRPGPGDNHSGWVASTGNAYPGGVLLTTTTASPANLVALPIPFDASFRTYVDAGSARVVPEPATLVLLGTGLVGAIRRRRRQR